MRMLIASVGIMLSTALQVRRPDRERAVLPQDHDRPTELHISHHGRMRRSESKRIVRPVHYAIGRGWNDRLGRQSSPGAPVAGNHPS